MALKVLIVGTYAPDHQYSLIGFANALCNGLPSYDIETRLIAPSPRLGQTILARGKGKRLTGHFDKLALFPRRLIHEARWADVVHFVDHGLAIYTKYLPDKPQIVTCNDLIAMRAARNDLPEWKSGSDTLPVPSPRFQRMIAQGLLRAYHVVCISQATRCDLHRLTGVARQHSSVIYDSLFHTFGSLPSEEARTHLQQLELNFEAPFLLHIGREVPTKNREGLLEIFRHLRESEGHTDLHLVFAGGELSSQMHQRIRAQNLENFVHERSHLKNVQIRALYSGALALVFPSFYEGFGLPIIEAQACRCPVFTSNRAPMTEVGGDGAVYFDPTRTREAAQIIAPVLRSPQQLKEMQDHGEINLRRFTPQTMFEAYSHLYRSVFHNYYSPSVSEDNSGRGYMS